MAAERAVPISRRRFLAQVGVLGAAALGGIAAGPLPTALTAGLGDDPLARLSGDAGAALRTLARDTFRGFVVWVVPGHDRWSQAQDEVSATPGAIDAQVDTWLMRGLDRLLPLPDELLHPAAEALATGLRDSPLGIDPPDVAGPTLAAADDALQTALANDGSVPAALVIALLLNHLAVQVDPTAIAGPFPAAPLANLSFADKTEAFRRLEEDTANVAAQIDTNLSEPMRRSLSGLLRLLGSALPTFTAFGSYSEFHVFDRRTRTATARPIGWDLATFSPGRRTPTDGWDEFLGYHKGVR